MRIFVGSAAAALAMVICASPVAAQAAGNGIEGVWKVSRVVITGATSRTWEHPQPSVWIFSRGYYSTVEDTSEAGRTAAPALKELGKPTDADKLARYAEWSQFGAAGGAYEVNGSTLIQHPIVAKSLSGLAEHDQLSEMKVSGDTAVLVNHSSPGQPERFETITLTRLR